MTTQDIIKILPFEEKEKMQILNLYEYMSPLQKQAIDELCWTSYFDLYNERVKTNLGIQFEMVKNGQEKIDKDFYGRALHKAEEEMTVESQESITQLNLSAARNAMQQIMHEIRAAKQEKKAAKKH